MRTFRYRARDGAGELYQATVDAESVFDASERLRADEIDLVGIEAIADSPRRLEPRGDRPPIAPRAIPDGITGTPGGMVLLIVGGLFVAIPIVFIVIGVALVSAGNSEGAWFALLPMVHLIVGSALLWFALGRRSQRRRIYRDGEVAIATVEGVGYNRSVRVNGRNPYELVWAFDLAGHRYHDKHSSFDEAILDFEPGDRLWVLYDPDDPEDSVEWPPLNGRLS